jgi:hypothetical protein
MAHPEDYEIMLFPRAPIGTFKLLIDVVARLWAVEQNSKLSGHQ